jgi:hypothetical protein
MSDSAVVEFKVVVGEELSSSASTRRSSVNGVRLCMYVYVSAAAERRDCIRGVIRERDYRLERETSERPHKEKKEKRIWLANGCARVLFGLPMVACEKSRLATTLRHVSSLSETACCYRGMPGQPRWNPTNLVGTQRDS